MSAVISYGPRSVESDGVDAQRMDLDDDLATAGRSAATAYVEIAAELDAVKAKLAQARAAMMTLVRVQRERDLRAGHHPTTTKVATDAGSPVTVVWQERYRALPDRALVPAEVVATSESARLRRGVDVAALEHHLGDAFDRLLPLLEVKRDRKLAKGTIERAALAYLRGDSTTGDLLRMLIDSTNAEPMVRTR